MCVTCHCKEREEPPQRRWDVYGHDSGPLGNRNSRIHGAVGAGEALVVWAGAGLCQKVCSHRPASSATRKPSAPAGPPPRSGERRLGTAGWDGRVSENASAAPSRMLSAAHGSHLEPVALALVDKPCVGGVCHMHEPHSTSENWQSA